MRGIGAALALALAGTAQAGVTIKMATLVPEGSIWHKQLKEVGDRWKEATGGDVQLRIYAGGVAGNEGDMVRKCRIGQLQGAAISAVGLRDITPEPQGVMTPGMIDSYAELDYVMERMGPKFEKILWDKGFQVIQWGEAGWVYFFSQSPARTPEEQKKQKVFAWSGDPGAVEAYNAAGFKPVVISSTDMIPSLQTGLIQSFNAAPTFALAANWYLYAKNMSNAKWGVMIGGTVVNRSTWEKIPAARRDELLRIARDITKPYVAQLRDQELAAIEAMKKNGLAYQELTAAELAVWARAAEATWPIVRGKSVPADIFDEIKRYRDEFRAKAGGK